MLGRSCRVAQYPVSTEVTVFEALPFYILEVDERSRRSGGPQPLRFVPEEISSRKR
jgi:hypothetical protein